MTMKIPIATSTNLSLNRIANLKYKWIMFYETEEKSEIIGCSCTLLIPYKGYTEGEVIEDYGYEIVVRLTSGKEVVEHRDEVLVYD